MKIDIYAEQLGWEGHRSNGGAYENVYRTEWVWCAKVDDLVINCTREYTTKAGALRSAQAKIKKLVSGWVLKEERHEPE